MDEPRMDMKLPETQDLLNEKVRNTKMADNRE